MEIRDPSGKDLFIHLFVRLIQLFSEACWRRDLPSCKLICLRQESPASLGVFQSAGNTVLKPQTLQPGWLARGFLRLWKQATLIAISCRPDPPQAGHTRIQSDQVNDTRECNAMQYFSQVETPANRHPLGHNLTVVVITL